MKSNKIKLIRPHYSGEELELIQSVLDSEYLVDGPMTREFETIIREITGAGFAVACTSATTGMEMALRTLNVGEGDEVIIPDFTHPATGLAVMATGASPVIVDVDLDTRNTTVDLVQSAVTPRTKAIMPVSWGGYPLPTKEFMTFCDEHELYMIDDAACSLGTQFDGIPTGAIPHFTVFSFHPRKIIATGDGGCVVTNSQEWAEKMESYKHFGITKPEGKTVFSEYGTNLRFPSVLAALGVAQLRHIDPIIKTRQKLKGIYDRELSGVPGVHIPIVPDSVIHNYQTYGILLDLPHERDRILTNVRAQGIEVQIGTVAIHREPVFKDARLQGDMVNSSLLADRLLALPLHHGLDEEDLLEVCSVLKSELTKH